MGTFSAEELQNASVLQELKKRKQVEYDAVRLRNRLLKLERQAHKAEKRIVQTKQRAQDILDQRERNEARNEQRKQIEEQLHLEIQQHREDITKCVPTTLQHAAHTQLAAWLNRRRREERHAG